MSELTANDRLGGLKMRYAIGLPGKVSKAIESVGAFLAVPRNRVLLEVAHRMMHSLTGSSGTYGFPEISGAARGAETILCESLESGMPLLPQQQLRLREQLAALEVMAVAAANPSAVEAK